MAISRLDLDEKGAGSPEGLVSRILKAEPSLSIPVPIEELCRKLDIVSIEYERLDGLEGALVTTPDRQVGTILVKETSHRFRQRFTIGHELGHFLIPTHVPNLDGRFFALEKTCFCSTLKSWTNDRAWRLRQIVSLL
jgi:Zn-dependent peptidase ImmA (M78 family)